MKLLSLDISTHTGFAVFLKVDGQKPVLFDYGLLDVKNRNIDYKNFDINSLKAALQMVQKFRDGIIELIDKFNPDQIIIEQTNCGRSRTAQKILEWLQLTVIYTILEKLEYYPKFIDTSKWRSVMNARLTKEDKKHNAKVKKEKGRGKIGAKHLSVRLANDIYGLELKMKDNDIADAIMIGTAYLREYNG